MNGNSFQDICLDLQYAIEDSFRNECNDIDDEKYVKFMSIRYILGVGKLLVGAAVDVLPGSKMICKTLIS